MKFSKDHRPLSERTLLRVEPQQPYPLPGYSPPLHPESEGLMEGAYQYAPSAPTFITVATVPGPPTAYSEGGASVISGYVDCCGMCSSGSHAKIVVDQDTVSFRREERGRCFGECCSFCSSMQEESIELEHLEMAEGSWGPDPVTFAWGYFGLLLGCIPGILCMTLSQLCPATTVTLTTGGDGRPSEEEPGFLRLPNGTYTQFWGRLLEFWEGNRAAGAVFAPPPPIPPSSHTLSITSRLSIAATRMLSLQARCCCWRKDVAAHARDVQWVRLPHPHVCNCDCCCCGTNMQLGVGRSVSASVRMDGIFSSSLVPHLKQAMLLRGATTGLRPAQFATPDCCTCGAQQSVVTVDTDFTQIKTPGETLLLRTSSIPFVYQKRSSLQCCKASFSALILLGLVTLYITIPFLMQSCYSDYRYDSYGNRSYYTSCYPAAGAIIPWVILSPFGLAFVWWLFTLLGLVSMEALAGFCCRFTRVTVGTGGAGAAEGVGGCCNKKGGKQKTLYKWTDSGEEAEVFVATARAAIKASLAADKAASLTGLAKA